MVQLYPALKLPIIQIYNTLKLFSKCWRGKQRLFQNRNAILDPPGI
jgi:hypothetical protein